MGRKVSAAAKSAAKASPGVSTSATDRRVDPADGQVVTYDEVQIKYAKMYSKLQIKTYWSNDCRSVPEAVTPQPLVPTAPEAEKTITSKEAKKPSAFSAFEQAKQTLDSELSVEAEQAEVKPLSLQPQQAQQGAEVEDAPKEDAIEDAPKEDAIEDVPKEDAIVAAVAREATMPSATPKPAVQGVVPPSSPERGDESSAQKDEEDTMPSTTSKPAIQGGVLPSSPERGDKSSAQKDEEDTMPSTTPKPAIQGGVPPSSPERGDKSSAQKEDTMPSTAPKPAIQGGVPASSPERGDKSSAQKETHPKVSTIASPQRCGESPNRTSPQRCGDSPNKASTPVNTPVTVTFSVPYQTSFGEEIVIVGNTAALGEWDPDKAVPMRWTEGHIWVTTIELEVPTAASGQSFEYKYILMFNGRVKMWEDCQNRGLGEVRPGSSLVCNNIWNDLSSALIRS